MPAGLGLLARAKRARGIIPQVTATKVREIDPTTTSSGMAPSTVELNKAGFSPSHPKWPSSSTSEGCHRWPLEHGGCAREVRAKNTHARLELSHAHQLAFIFQRNERTLGVRS